MGELRSMAWWLVFVGGFVLLMGLLMVLAGRIPFLGRLPGDIRIERDGFTLYFPIVTCLLLSLLLTIIVNVAWRLLQK